VVDGDEAEAPSIGIESDESDTNETEDESGQSEPDESEETVTTVPIPRELRNLQMTSQWIESRTESAPANQTRTRYGRVINSTQPIASNPNSYDSYDMHHALTQKNPERTHLFYIEDTEEERIYSFSAEMDESVQPEPRQYKDAIRASDATQWKAAMQEEINSMKRLGVWTIVPCPKGLKPIKGRWVYKNKLGENNELVRRKARFVAKGFLQVYGRDFFDTHSPVAKMKSIKLVLSLTASRDLELLQMDFDTAFLNAPVEEDIYMEQPEGFHEGQTNMVCKLNKAIYGLKQASRNWNKTIHSFMVKIGYRPLKTDPCVYIKKTKTKKLIMICLYVDDTVIAVHRDDLNEWIKDKKFIAETYAVKDLGQCQWILNMKVTRDRTNRTITLSQQAYIERILAQFEMEEARSVSTPAAKTDLLLPVDGTIPAPLNPTGAERYRSLIGALLYAANITRPDIAYIVGQLCRYVAEPCHHHQKAANRVLKYLHDTLTHCMVFGQFKIGTGEDKPELIAFSDADWAGDKESYKSTSGSVIRFNGDIISWLSKKQKSVAQSSAEAEYMALADTTKEILWYRQWIIEVLGTPIAGLIFGDNRASLQLSKNDTIHERSKHIAIRYHLVRDETNKGTIHVAWVSTADMQADIMTKPLDPGIYTRFRNMMLIPAFNYDA
jgi:hypothetical protein